MSWRKGKAAKCPRLTTRKGGLFNTRQQQSIGIPLAWTDEHRSTDGRGRTCDGWLRTEGHVDGDKQRRESDQCGEPLT